MTVAAHNDLRDRARQVLNAYPATQVQDALHEARAALEAKRVRAKGVRRLDLNRRCEILAKLEVHYVQLLIALIEERPALIRERLSLAMLASPKPMFDNPVIAWGAQILRDEVLREAGLLPAPGQLGDVGT